MKIAMCMSVCVCVVWSVRFLCNGVSRWDWCIVVYIAVLLLLFNTKLNDSNGKSRISKSKRRRMRMGLFRVVRWFGDDGREETTTDMNETDCVKYVETMWPHTIYSIVSYMKMFRVVLVKRFGHKSTSVPYGDLR